MPRLAFLKEKVIAEISICDEAFAAQWCKVKGFDGWLAVSVDHGVEVEPIRRLSVGDRLTLDAGAIRADKAIALDKVKQVAEAVLSESGLPTGTYKAAVDVEKKPAQGGELGAG